MYASSQYFNIIGINQKLPGTVVVRGGHHTTDNTKVKSVATTIRQHLVGFQVYCNLNHHSVHPLTKKVNI